MNSYSAELRTPPLPLVAFVGCPELHKDIGTFFSQVLRPPLVSVGVAEANEHLLTRLLGPKKGPPKAYATPDGLVKADWFQKQRQRRAAVALVLVPRAHVEGGPSEWQALLGQLRTVRDATAGRGAEMLVAVVGEGAPTQLPPDRVAALVSHLDIDPKVLVPLSRQDLLTGPDSTLRREEALRALGRMLSDMASAFYLRNAQRIRDRQLEVAAMLGSCPAELSVACAFKLAVMAEFRQDWAAAVGCYQAAYAALAGVPLGAPLASPQRHAEVVRVAEVVHFKSMMLLLHQGRTLEALDQFRRHVAHFGTLPEGLPLPAAAAHWGWLARQYQAAADMVAGRVDPATLAASARDCAPAALLEAAASLTLRRRGAVDALRALRAQAGAPAPAPEALASVKRGAYIGQLVARTEGGGTRDLSDLEFCNYLEAEELRMAAHPHAASSAAGGDLAGGAAVSVADALAAALAALTEGRQGRRRAALARQLAAENLATGNAISARKQLLQVVYVYRRDGWDAPLAAALLQLRQACWRLKLQPEAIACTLELAALGASGPPVGGGGEDTHGAALVEATEVQAALDELVSGAAAARHSSLKGGGAAAGGSGDTRVAASVAAGLAGGEAASQHAPDAAAAAPAASAPGAPPAGVEYWVEWVDLKAALRAAAESAQQQHQQQQQPPGGPGAECAAAAPARVSAADLLLRHRQQDFGWVQCVLPAWGFLPAPPDPPSLAFCCAFANQLPLPLPVEGVELGLTDALGSWTLEATPGMPPADGGGGVPGALAAARSDAEAATGPLPPRAWRRFHAAFTPRCAGRVVVERATLRLGPRAAVSFRTASFPAARMPGGADPPWATAARWSRSAPPPSPPFPLAACVRRGAVSADVAHVGKLPVLALLAPPLALVGEFVPVEAAVEVGGMPLRGARLELSLNVGPSQHEGVAERGGQASDADADAPHALAAPTLLTLREGRLAALPHEQVTQLPLPVLPAHGRHLVRLWLRATCRLRSVRVAATLLCPAPVTAALELSVEEPFAHSARLFGETGVHTLVGPSTAFRAGGASAAGAAATTMPAAAPPLPLVIGQAVMVQVMVRAEQDARLQLLGAETRIGQHCGLQLVNQVGQQLPEGATLQVGDVQTVLMHVCPTRLSAVPLSLGKLMLRWRRASGGAAAQPTSKGVEAEGAQAPPEEVVTALQLPRVTVVDSLVIARVTSPPQVTAGIAFPYTLQLRNFTQQPQDATLTVQESHGFVFSGDKHQALCMAPGNTTTLRWMLVAHASGLLPLPSIKVTASRFSCAVMTQSNDVHVLPF